MALPPAFALALSLLWPQPREFDIAPLVQLRLPLQVVAPAELAGPAALLRRELANLFGAGDGPGGTVMQLALDPSALKRAEEYAIDPSADRVVLRAHDAQGAFWAVHSLVTMLSQARAVTGGWSAAVPKVHDWPETAFRAFMIQGAWTRSLDEFKRNLELLARLKVTYVALEFGPQVVLDFDPSIAEGGKFTKAQAREVIEYGRSLGLKPIAYLNLLGHLDRGYKKAGCTQHDGIDIRSDEVYDKFVYPILRETLEVYGPVEYFHAGMDEAWELFTWLSKEGYDVTSLIARHVERVNAFLKARGVKLVIWHDMFLAPDLAKQLKAPVGPANGGPPQNTAAALAKIPKDVVLDYWFYDPLAAYPALDWLQQQGFTVWASPWQTPYSLTRYALKRQVPVLGTLWAGPPGCFASPTFSPVTAHYAQAVWDASRVPAEVRPEPTVVEAAQRATNAVLWRRRQLTCPAPTALCLTPDGPVRQTVAGAPRQFGGVPLATDRPVAIDPLPEASKPLTNAASAAQVRLPGGLRLALDGVNSGRGVDQLILYAAPRAKTGTNLYGCEVLVSANGTVLSLSDYGAGDHAVPVGGFVLSAHQGPKPVKANRLLQLRPGDRVAVLDAKGDWLGGYAPALLLVALPGGQTIRVDGEDAPREADQLVLYHASYGDGHTGTNAFGCEVVVRNGQVVTVRDGAGNAAVPDDGYVLSAHHSATATKHAALRAVRPGDRLRLLWERDGKRVDLGQALAERSRTFAVGARCAALYLSVSAAHSSQPGTPLGEWLVRYADGSAERIPCRYGREVLPTGTDALPQRTDDPVWMIQEPGWRGLVREWANPHADRPVKEVVFVPSAALLEIGARIMAATAAALG